MTNSHNYPSSTTIHRETLPNGITVLVYERPGSQSVTVEGYLLAGALAETAEFSGLANLTAVSLMRGSQNYSFDDIYEKLEAVGADLSISSGYHLTSFSAQSLTEDADLVLDLLASVLRQPTFPEPQLNQLKGQIITALQMRANDTQQMASRTLRELIYPNHPYGRSQTGTFQSIPSLTVAHAQQFHANYYGPMGMVICFVGALTPAQAVAKVQQTLGDWHNPAQQALPELPELVMVNGRLHHHHVMPDKYQSDIALGRPGPTRAAPDYLAASLMNTVLGVFGMMGRIGKNVREAQGLAYYAYSSLQGGLGPGAWLAAAGVSPDKVEQATSSILDEIARIQNEPVPADELANSQAYRIGSLPVGLETSSGLASVITDMELYGWGLDYLLQFPDLVQAITPDDVQAAAQKYLSTEHLGIAIAGPEAE
ncbi:MAG: insulinase family protein [Ardenticatenaceae bacterium]|nr:insulinase family protein [Anaerolineales bacterium]MCB8940621.1 insulinase family protein [Ardenticatenaceae bacterium]MCB8971951.1 insulinase family protein [Ardenticatenaceae bacterium]